MINISDLAARHGVTLRTLRFYEQKGLIKPKREGRRRRLYTEDDSQKLGVILEAAALGFSLREIPGLIVEVNSGFILVVPADVAQRQLAIMSERLNETKIAVASLTIYAAKAA